MLFPKSSTIIFFFFMLLCNFAFAQQPQEKVYLTFDLSKPASFPGGQAGAFRYIKDHFQYPKNPGKIAGNRLIFAFVVEKDGTVKKETFRFFETPGKVFSKAGIRFIQGIKWNPAEANGHPVRNLMSYCFFFQHDIKRISWQEAGLDFYGYDQLMKIPKSELSKLGFKTKPVYFGISPEDSLVAEPRYPEAARLAHIQGIVELDFLIGKDGTVRKVGLKNDIGYGCGEEALRVARYFRYWVPAQHFDSVFEEHACRLVAFCPNPEQLEASNKLFQEDDLWSTQVNDYYKSNLKSGHFLYAPPRDGPEVAYDGSVVEFEFTIKKSGENDSIVILSSPNPAYSALVRQIMMNNRRYSAPECCSKPCNVRFHRYATFKTAPLTRERHWAERYVALTRENPAETPDLFPPEDDTIYEAEEVDQAAYYLAPGEKGIQDLLTRHWPERHQDLPPGGQILVKLLVRKDGSPRDFRIVQGINPESDKKALNVAASMHFWVPAIKNGHPVSSWQTMRFR